MLLLAWPWWTSFHPVMYVGGLSFALGIPPVEMGVQLNTFWCLTSPLLSCKAKNMRSGKIQAPTVILVPHFAFCVSSFRSYWAHKSYVVFNFDIYIYRYIYTVCPTKFCILNTYEVKSLEFPNSKTTLWSKTFDFAYWGTFSTQNSELFVQTEHFLDFKNGFALLKFYLVKIFEDRKTLKILFRIHNLNNFSAKGILKILIFQKTFT